jgi:hypothetical protein
LNREDTVNTQGYGSRFRKLFSAVGLVGGGLFLAAEEVIDPTSAGTSKAYYEAGLHHHGRLVATAALLVISSALVVAGVAGSMRLIRRRGGIIAHAGAGLLVLGAFGHVMIAILDLVFAASGKGDSAQMIALFERLNGASTSAIAAPLIIGFPLGGLLFIVGLWRGRVIPSAALGFVLTAIACAVALPDSTVAGPVKQLLGTCAFALVARALLGRGERAAEEPAGGSEPLPA